VTATRLLLLAQRLEPNKSSAAPWDQVKRMHAMYLERAKEAKARTGN
jgi:hypothetical protein